MTLLVCCACKACGLDSLPGGSKPTLHAVHEQPPERLSHMPYTANREAHILHL